MVGKPDLRQALDTALGLLLCRHPGDIGKEPASVVLDAVLDRVPDPADPLGHPGAFIEPDGPGAIEHIAAVIGFITLFGIATRNGVILIDHIRQLGNEGQALRQAIINGAEERLIPILMTALATALALIPLAMAAGEPGSEIQAPMAVVILWGLFSSTVLNMLVIPAVYLRFAHGKMHSNIASASGDACRPSEESRQFAATLKWHFAVVEVNFGTTMGPRTRPLMPSYAHPDF